MSQKTRLLIVDDSNIIRTRIESAYLGSDEIEVVGKAVDGRDALLQVRKLKPDLVTMDITMPVIDGVETTRRIIAIYPSIKILLVSALTDRSTGVEAIRNGARGFLNKPFTDDQLRSAIEKVLAGKDREMNSVQKKIYSEKS